ncbi:MAG TPA: nuclease-related domain-containing protein [Xanthomonadales bacterium]|nr:nuclease-related domain-containing protein [Xanthomonadales bacterium]
MTSTISQHWHLVWMVAAFFLIVYLGSPRHNSRRAFVRVKRLLEQTLDKRRFTQFHNIAIPTGGGTEEIDHVLVSRFGVFVIVSEFRSGEITGGESQEQWKEKRLGRIHRWPNPLYRAKLQMESLQRILDMPREKFRLLVVVDGQDKPSKKWPEQVLTTQQLLSFLHNSNDQVLSPEQADLAARLIMEKQLPVPKKVTKTNLVRYGLAVMILAGIFMIYRDDLARVAGNFDQTVERLASPQKFDQEGARKSEQELFEESLVCAYSQDTNRCSCYQKEGEKVDVDFELCRQLSERGSILNQ